MLNLKSLVAASAALTLLSGGSASVVVRRNEEPSRPSCTTFTPFVYAGCFTDPSNPERALLYDSGLNTQNMTTEICVAFCKGNGYKYAGLEYYGECFCGASVNGPQIDNSNCNYPCTGNPSEVCGGNDIVSIYQDTTFPTVSDSTIADYKPMGCYSEGVPGRSLAWRQNQLPTANLTVESCLTACKYGGYSFAGVEYGQECYCGVVLGNGTLPLPASQCNMPCTGNSAETCGGSSTLNLYVATDLESSQPCNAPPPPVYSSTTSAPVSTSTTSSSSSTSSTTSTTPVSSSTSSTTAPAPPPPTTSSTTTPAPPPPTTSSTKTSASLCTSTVTVSPTPTCEYKCGSWCSNALPAFTDSNSCGKAVSACSVQLASCFLTAGFPDSMNCFQFASWCNSVSSYCGNYCPGNSCSLGNCKSKYPPSGPSPPAPSLSTTVYTCPGGVPPTSTSTTAAASTTSCVPVPTNSNICNQPNNPWNGYTSSSPVGGIGLPCLTCNNLKSDYNSGNQLKLYTSPDTSKCPSYPKSWGAVQGCKDSCDSQYTSCVNVYAQGCKNNFRGDTYASASQKCKNQWTDCYSTNSGVSVSSNRCGSYNTGWW